MNFEIKLKIYPLANIFSNIPFHHLVLTPFQMSKAVNLTTTNTNSGPESIQGTYQNNSPISQSPQKFVILERDVPPVQQQYILPHTSAEEKVEPEALSKKCAPLYGKFCRYF